MKKIVVIGRTYPYKGGISHFNTLLYNNLSKYFVLTIFGWKRLYPKFLYPSDPIDQNGSDNLKIKSQKIIDYLNPITWIILLYRIKRIKPDLLIMNWFHPIMFPIYFFITFIVNKIFKTEILYICHNVFPHEKNIPFLKMFMKLSFLFVDYFIVHSKTDKIDLLKIKKNANVVHGFLPLFNSFTNIKSHNTSLNSNKLNNTLLFFGFVRDYKGLDSLIKAMPKVLKSIDVDLLIAGEFWKNKSFYLDLINKLNLINKVKIIDKYIPDNKINDYFKRCDVVILPYKSATQSAIVQLAYSHNTPVIASDVGGLSESVIDNKTGFLTKINDSQDISEKIIEYYQGNKKNIFINNINNIKNNFSWDKYIKLIKDNFV